MLSASWVCLRAGAKATRAAGLPSLRRRLRHLRQSNRAAEGYLRERRRLHRLLHDERKSAPSPGTSAGGTTSSANNEAIQLLPRNDSLEAAMALSISENRDARTELELVRRLVNSTLLSFASPVAPRWDPYDVKPQVFALNTYIALPVFTSIEYLRLFCQRFGFAVRDPSGVLWASAAYGDTADGPVAGLLPDAVTHSEWWRQRHAAPVRDTKVSAEEEGGEKDSQDAAHTMAAPAAAEFSDGIFEATGGASELFDGADGALPKRDAPRFSTATNAAASPAAEPLDADALFDAMLLDGAEGAAASAPSPPVDTRVRRKRSAARTALAQRHRGRGGLRAKGGSKVRPLLKKRGHPSRHRRSVAKAPSATSSGPKAGNANSRNHDSEAEAAAKTAYWQSVAQTAPFALTQATPLPTFGPFMHPFLIGYFADISTLLHNASIVPEKVDIVVNPTSPIEFVLSRAATDRVLRKEQLLHGAYMRVEKELQREFSQFFATHCPEVLHASSACVPLPMDVDEVAHGRQASRVTRNSSPSGNALQEYRERTQLLREAEYRNGVAYEITILIHSTSLEETFVKIQHAKHRSMLMGHADLDVLPEMAAAPHVREMAQRFYDGQSEHARQAAERQTALSAEGGSLNKGESEEASAAQKHATKGSKMGVFVRRGTPHTINIAQSPDSFFHDPTNAYTEAHAIFTEELKVKRGK